MMELGATVCTPRAPACLNCPLVELCATRGETARSAKTARQNKREIHYALDYRSGEVFLVRRPHDARLMADMWELPELIGLVAGKDKKQKSPRARSDESQRKKKINGNARTHSLKTPLFTVRHSITVTDYTVRVWPTPAPSGVRGEWIAAHRLGRIALTGLTRKILRKAEIFTAPSVAH